MSENSLKAQEYLPCEDAEELISEVERLRAENDIIQKHLPALAEVSLHGSWSGEVDNLTQSMKWLAQENAKLQAENAELKHKYELALKLHEVTK